MRRTARRARAAAERAALLAEYTDDLVGLLDQAGRFVYASPTYQRTLGLEPSSLIGARLFDLIHPDDRDGVQELWARAAPQEAVSMTFRQRGAGNGWRWLRARMTPIAWRGERARISVAHDITDYHQAEEERARLLRREQSARAVADAASARTARLQAATAVLAEALTPEQVAEVIVVQGVAAVGASAGSIVLLTDSGEWLDLLSATGYPQEVLDSWRRFSIATPSPLSEALRTGVPVLLESSEARAERYPQLAEPRITSTGHAWAALPLLVKGRAIGGMGLSFEEPRVFTADERTLMMAFAQQCALALDRARLYEAERRARIDAEAAVRVRDQFLQVASHELKTPLTVLYGNAQLLARRAPREGGLNERDERIVRVIIDQAGRLNKLIEAMLDITRLQSGQLAVVRERVDLCALARHAVAEARPSLTDHTVDCATPAEALAVDGDPLLLAQVLQTLVQNAVKYSPTGGQIWVLVDRLGEHACVQVRDQGLGIPAAALPHLFQRFYRASNVEAQQISGLGIGLYVAHEIMALHGGTIAVESTEGVGSTFTVCLPLARSSSGAPGAPAERAVGGPGAASGSRDAAAT